MMLYYCASKLDYDKPPTKPLDWTEIEADTVEDAATQFAGLYESDYGEVVSDKHPMWVKWEGQTPISVRVLAVTTYIVDRVEE